MLWPRTYFEGGPNLLQRLALVLWWLSLIVSLLFVAGFTASLMLEPDTFILLACGLAAAMSWAVGRALFFILAGR
jgi:hypothetical protein